MLQHACAETRKLQRSLFPPSRINRLLNARMGMLARQPDAVRGDLAGVADVLNRYFDPAARQTQQMASTLQQMRTEVTQWDVPRIDDSLAALASASGK